MDESTAATAAFIRVALRGRRVRGLLLVWTAAALAVVSGARPARAQAVEPGTAANFHLQWRDERLTLASRSAPLTAVLAELARQSGLRIDGLEQLAVATSVDLERERLLPALDLLLADFNFALVGAAGGGDSATRRTVLYIRGRADTTRMTATPSSEAEPPVDTTDTTGPSDGARPLSSDQQQVMQLAEAGLFDISNPADVLAASAKSANALVRVQALQALAIQGTSASSRLLDEALDDADPLVRSTALGLLIRTAGADAITRLGDLLQRDDPAVRSAAVMALGERSDPEATFQLQRALTSSDDVVRDLAAGFLRQRQQATTGGIE